MAKKKTGKKIGETVGTSIEDVSGLVKAAAHPARLQIMTLLVDGRKEFSSILKMVGKSKTALSNHLERMLEMGLVERVGRGEYRLTEDGHGLYGAITTFYDNSKARQERRTIRVRDKYSEAYKEDVNPEVVVSSEPVYQPCWISYLGAVSGVLKSLGKDSDIVDVGGYTGYIFITNVFRGTTCPSGPTAHSGWKEIMPATSVLGLKARGYADGISFPQSKGPLSTEDHERASRLFEEVKRSIDSDIPVVLWGLDIPEYGIVKGYKGNEYIVSTYRRPMKKPDDPIRYDALESPGSLHAIIFGEKTPEITEKDDKEALRRAVRLAEGLGFKDTNYVAGPNAFDEWANVLESGSGEQLNYHGNSYVAACYEEGKSLAAVFLKRLAKRHAGKPQARHLTSAAKEYEQEAQLIKKLTALFPFAFKGEMTPENCRKGAELLRKAKERDIRAIAHMSEAVKSWR